MSKNKEDNKTTCILIRITPELKDKASKYAKSKGVSLSKIIRLHLWDVAIEYEAILSREIGEEIQLEKL